ncbi:hypothetical protein EMCRGX_G001210 [Ephydatia muelleri]
MSSREAERAAPTVPTAANDVAQILEGMRQGEEEPALQIERNARKDTYSFKRRGNELQYRFNAEVADKVAAAASLIEKVETTSIRSKELLDRVARDLSGWLLTREGEDWGGGREKRMEKAENRAERKLAKKRKIKEARMKDNVGAKWAIPPSTLWPFPAKGADAMKEAGTSLKPPPQFPAGTCFECGGPQPLEEGMPKVA